METSIITQRITAAEAARRGETDKLIEISEGQWEQQTVASPEHARIGLKLGAKLLAFVEAQGLGEVYGADASFVLEGTPDNIITMRLPDVSFVAAARVQRITEGYSYLAPDLAVEIISPSERPGKIHKKLGDYFRSGVRQVWLVYPEKKQVVIHQPDGTATTYSEQDTLSSPEVLPDFTLDIKSLFQ